MDIDFMLEYVLSGMVGIMRYYFHDKSRGSTNEMVAMVYKIMQGDIVKRLRGMLGEAGRRSFPQGRDAERGRKEMSKVH